MNRFNTGFIQYHSLLRDLEFYWRVEPESKYLCDIDFDPFLVMKENNKKFGKLTAIASFSALSQRLISLTSKNFKKQRSLSMMVRERKIFQLFGKLHATSSCHIGHMLFLGTKAYSL